MKPKISNFQNNAVKANRAAALKDYDVTPLISQTAIYTALFIRTFAKLKGTPITSENCVEIMRELGGFEKVIKTILPTEPDPVRSGAGIPTNPEWYKWEAGQNQIQAIEISVKSKLFPNG